jgi:hypothetical protein
MKTLALLAGLLVHGVALGQSTESPAAESPATNLNYTYAELRFVDVDSNSGDGLSFKGSYDLNNNWLIVGGITSLDFNNNVDATLIEIGAGYVWDYNADFDLVATLRYVNASIDNPGGDDDDSGFALSAGTRGMLTPQFEIRGSVNHINLDDSDTYLELAGDYHFTPRFSAGLSLEFAGDTDVITIGGRWYFR